MNPRFICLACGSSFCLKAFSLTYYRKRPELLRPVSEPVVSDHFEIFELTQDLPFGVGPPVGARHRQ